MAEERRDRDVVGEFWIALPDAGHLFPWVLADRSKVESLFFSQAECLLFLPEIVEIVSGERRRIFLGKEGLDLLGDEVLLGENSVDELIDGDRFEVEVAFSEAHEALLDRVNRGKLACKSLLDERWVCPLLTVSLFHHGLS